MVRDIDQNLVCSALLKTYERSSVERCSNQFKSQSSNQIKPRYELKVAAELISVNSTSSWLFVEGCHQMQSPFFLLRLKSKRLFLWILGAENACILHAASGDAGDRTPDFSHAKRTLYHWVTSPTNVTAVTVETLLQLTFIPSQSITNVFPHINYIYYTYTRYMHYSSIMIFFSPH